MKMTINRFIQLKVLMLTVIITGCQTNPINNMLGLDSSPLSIKINSQNEKVLDIFASKLTENGYHIENMSANSIKSTRASQGLMDFLNYSAGIRQFEEVSCSVTGQQVTMIACNAYNISQSKQTGERRDQLTQAPSWRNQFIKILESTKNAFE